MIPVVIVIPAAAREVVRVKGETFSIVIKPPAAPPKLVLVTPSNRTIFPDFDPHLPGAGYWLGGILTRSAG